jgi:DNA-directed RNA polymerase specialized sigma subunit
MKFEIYFLLIITATIVKALHLSQAQSLMVTRLCQTPDLPVDQRLLVNRLLINAYKKWATKQAIEFKEFHGYKCRNIRLDDLDAVAQKGLCHSVRNYNGQTHFPNYAAYYVKGELYNLVTDHYYLSKIPRKDRIKNKSRLSEEELLFYREELVKEKEKEKDQNRYQDKNNLLLNHESPIPNPNKQAHHVNDIEDPFIRRIVSLKYDPQTGARLKNNRQIAADLGCCEETVRQKLAINKSKRPH